MKNTLVVASRLSHDGDGLVRYSIAASSEDFAASTETWGNPSHVGNLANALRGFSKDVQEPVRFRFGTPQTGTCELTFSCLDRFGHTAVWVAIEAPFPTALAQKFERAELFLQTDPASIDRFADALSKFVANADNQALLECRAES